MNTILVTCATSTIGQRVVKNLRNAHIKVRAGVRSLRKSSKILGDNVEVVTLDFEKPDTYLAALEGVEKVFFILPVIPNQVEITRAFTKAAKNKGVKKIVMLSGLGADTKSSSDILRWHGEKEKIIRKSGIHYTILRPGNFMQNYIVGCYSKMYANGKLTLPQGDAKINQVDANDIAAAATSVLMNFGHKDRIYSLTGYSYTNMEIVDLISNIIGKKIEYVDITEEVARAKMKKCNVEDWRIDTTIGLHRACKEGLMEAYSLDLKNLIGKGPTTFAEFAIRHKTIFSS